jgi:arginase
MATSADAVSFRRALPSEAGAVRGLIVRSMGHWDRPPGYLEAARELMSLSAEDLRRDDAWVVLVDGAVAGFYRLSRTAETAEIEEFHLEPPMIGRGIGRRMFEHASERGRAMGARWLVWSTDANSLGFYLRMGGEVTGTTPSGLEADEPLVCMRLELGSRWVLLGAPWDCSGTGRGEALAPTALRAAGIGRLVGEDLGDCPIRIRGRDRDLESGVLALADTIQAAEALTAAVEHGMHTRDGRLLVIGGDCSILLGIIPAVRQALGQVGLWFVDGHPDFSDSHASSTGETADLELACVTGDGPAILTGLGGRPPLVEPRDVVIIGHRTRNLDAESQAEVDRLPPAIHQFDADAVLRDPAGTGTLAADALGHTRDAWLHIDLDVLDPASLAAVTYPLSGGPGWDELSAALQAIAASPSLRGVSVADFRPDLDPDGTLALRVVGLVETVLSAGAAD